MENLDEVLAFSIAEMEKIARAEDFDIAGFERFLKIATSLVAIRAAQQASATPGDDGGDQQATPATGGDTPAPVAAQQTPATDGAQQATATDGAQQTPATDGAQQTPATPGDGGGARMSLSLPGYDAWRDEYVITTDGQTTTVTCEGQTVWKGLPLTVEHILHLHLVRLLHQAASAPVQFTVELAKVGDFVIADVWYTLLVRFDLEKGRVEYLVDSDWKEDIFLPAYNTLVEALAGAYELHRDWQDRLREENT